MIEINAILEEYASDAYYLYSTTISENEWGDKKVALDYLNKYFLDKEDYLKTWKPIQDIIFQNQEEGFPAKIFQDEFSLISILGGILFERDDFESLQNCIKEVGDKQLIIVQNDFGGKFKKPILRMKYPVDVTWEEVMSGNFISTVLFEMFANEYFVFSESGIWGKYSANDEIHPVEIIGFKPECKSIFTTYFKQANEDLI